MDTKHSIRRLEGDIEYSAALINQYHSYIQYANRPSRKMYYALYEDSIQVGVFGLGSAFTFPKAIKTLMEEKSIGFNEIANNIVYVLNGHTDKNAGTIFLKLVRNDAVKWWKERYGDTLKMFQTFILPPRTGAMYKADNWIFIGETSGHSQETQTVKEGTPNAQKHIIHGTEIYLLKTPKEVKKKLMFVRFAKEIKSNNNRFF